MIDLSVTDALLGLGLGALGGVLFFAGLALGIRLALKGRAPGLMLLASTAIRLAMLLGLAWLAVGQGLVSALCFLAAFMIVRTAATAWAGAPLKRLEET